MPAGEYCFADVWHSFWHPQHGTFLPECMPSPHHANSSNVDISKKRKKRKRWRMSTGAFERVFNVGVSHRKKKLFHTVEVDIATEWDEFNTFSFWKAISLFRDTVWTLCRCSIWVVLVKWLVSHSHMPTFSQQLMPSCFQSPFPEAQHAWVPTT